MRFRVGGFFWIEEVRGETLVLDIRLPAVTVSVDERVVRDVGYVRIFKASDGVFDTF